MDLGSRLCLQRIHCEHAQRYHVRPQQSTPWSCCCSAEYPMHAAVLAAEFHATKVTAAGPCYHSCWRMVLCACAGAWCCALVLAHIAVCLCMAPPTSPPASVPHTMQSCPPQHTQHLQSVRPHQSYIPTLLFGPPGPTQRHCLAPPHTASAAAGIHCCQNCAAAQS
jgi:hypothetical protein